MDLIIRFANTEDIAALSFLAETSPREVLSAPQDWSHRLGDGSERNGAMTFIAEIGAEAVGFLWGDNAMVSDIGMPLNWLCINAVFVTPACRNQRVGFKLVTAAIERALVLSKDIVHGSCLPNLAGWWACDRFHMSLRFTVLDPGVDWKSPVTVDGKNLEIGFNGNCTFWMWVSEPRKYVLTSREPDWKF